MLLFYVLFALISVELQFKGALSLGIVFLYVVPRDYVGYFLDGRKAISLCQQGSIRDLRGNLVNCFRDFLGNLTRCGFYYRTTYYGYYATSGYFGFTIFSGVDFIVSVGRCSRGVATFYVSCDARTAYILSLASVA